MCYELTSPVTAKLKSFLVSLRIVTLHIEMYVTASWVEAVGLTIHVHYSALGPRTQYATHEGGPESMLGEHGQAQRRTGQQYKIEPEPLTGHVRHAGQEQISGGRP